MVRRNCPKCNEKVLYINSERFRVNANKNSIDIWLIYQCEKCKSTWNMTIYERIKPYDIDKYEYEKMSCCTSSFVSCATTHSYKYRSLINNCLYLVFKIFSVCGLKIFFVINFIYSW